jgi:hypothetical protein
MSAFEEKRNDFPETKKVKNDDFLEIDDGRLADGDLASCFTEVEHHE